MNIQKFLSSIFLKKENTIPPEEIREASSKVICPRCCSSFMEYDGLLNVRCKDCGCLMIGSHT